MWKRFKHWTAIQPSEPVHFLSKEVIVSNKKFTLRIINEADIDELLRIEREIYNGKTPWNYQSFARELRKIRWSLYLGLFNNKEMVAFIGLNWNRYEAHITNFAISIPYQRQGIGKWLLNYVIDYSKNLDVEVLTLEVSVENIPAINLYHLFKFQNGVVKRFYYSFNNGDAMNMYLKFK